MFEKARSLRFAKESHQVARTELETALRDKARRVAAAVADDVAITFMSKASRTKCTEEAIAR